MIGPPGVFQVFELSLPCGPGGIERQELKRNIAMKPGIVGSEHLTRSAAAIVPRPLGPCCTCYLRYFAVYVVSAAGVLMVCVWAPPSDHERNW